MSLKLFKGFHSLETHHCVTGSMLHIYDFHHHPISEDMLLGIGAGLGFLHYFTDLREDFQFGGHVIAIGGYDAETSQVLVADRDKPLHPVSLEDIAKARGSTFKPFPPRHMWFTFDFSGKRQPHTEEIRQAIREVCTTMLEGPISNIGVRDSDYSAYPPAGYD